MKPIAAALAVAITAFATPPAFAQSDVVGDWATRVHEDAPERGPGPDIGEYMGSSANAQNIARAKAWSGSLITLPEHQCKPHPSDYVFNFQSVRISKEVHPLTQQLIAYRTHTALMNADRRIYMDGRPHPGPEALHTWEGFSTGHWEGDTLVVDTTHLKLGFIKRNGLQRSESAKVREYFTRTDNVLTWTVIIDDPVYLSEPFIRNRDFWLDPGMQITMYPCSTDVEIPRPEGEVPFYLEGTNDQLPTFAKAHNLPLEVVMAGAETMYPEYQARITHGYVAPGKAAASSKRGGK
jgi:hypothetical protein